MFEQLSNFDMDPYQITYKVIQQPKDNTFDFIFETDDTRTKKLHRNSKANKDIVCLVDVPFPPNLSAEDLIRPRNERCGKVKVPNKFFIYRKWYTMCLGGIGRKNEQTSISRYISEKWRNEPQGIKDFYHDLSMQANEEEATSDNESVAIVNCFLSKHKAWRKQVEMKKTEKNHEDWKLYIAVYFGKEKDVERACKIEIEGNKENEISNLVRVIVTQNKSINKENSSNFGYSGVRSSAIAHFEDCAIADHIWQIAQMEAKTCYFPRNLYGKKKRMTIATLESAEEKVKIMEQAWEADQIVQKFKGSYRSRYRISDAVKRNVNRNKENKEGDSNQENILKAILETLQNIKQDILDIKQHNNDMEEKEDGDLDNTVKEVSNATTENIRTKEKQIRKYGNMSNLSKQQDNIRKSEQTSKNNNINNTNNKHLNINDISYNASENNKKSKKNSKNNEKTKNNKDLISEINNNNNNQISNLDINMNNNTVDIEKENNNNKFMRIATQNIKGIISIAKQMDWLNNCIEKEFDIIGLTET
ncbi:682_t:CDS:2 [Diversispora eburnea]|uniref:682_t:CDS:1 n=1 Tax=Diversispora eburnea TaxID=1213867 RepID=A0A9N9FRQ9_9GLOM|nr:682_t:CDS:2 [Diversispora eburnea]